MLFLYEITIGKDKVELSDSAKLLGVTIDEKQKWKQHLSELTTALNYRTFAIRRISNQLPKNEVLKVVQCLWMSKLRYGLQLCNQVRTKPEDSTNLQMNAIQVCQNKMLRMLDRVSDACYFVTYTTFFSCINVSYRVIFFSHFTFIFLILK